jgi:hypothetical protein
MALMDKVKQALKGRSSSLEQGIDKAVQQVNARTKGKYGDTLSKGADALKKGTRQLDEERRDRPAGGAGTAGPSEPPVHPDDRDPGPTAV